MAENTSSYAVELLGLSKAFGSVQANIGINLKVRSGTVHAIVGENGAGKSTAMKMLYGMVRPDSGEIRVRGERLKLRSSQDAIRAGIGMVHQHFMLAGPYSVLENIILGAEREGHGSNIFTRLIDKLILPIDRSGARAKLDAIKSRYGLSADWDANIEELGVGVQQRIEIIKLLYRNAQVLILDEPTAVLTPQETHELFVQLRKMRDEGKTILIITHKLKEVLELADEVTVFRAGEVVDTREVKGVTTSDLAALMVGRKVNLTIEAPPPPKLGATVLEVRDLRLESDNRGKKPILSSLDFEVRSGEVVGIAGVEGNGQSELLSLLSRPADYLSELSRNGGKCSGSVRVLGQLSIENGSSLITDYALKSGGMGVIPEDRHRDGLLLGRPIMESYLLGRHRNEPFSRAGILSNSALMTEYASAADQYDIRPRMPQILAQGLSGGNQQKVIAARELGAAPQAIIAAQPTRGVDVGAIEFIHTKIIEARNRGAGVLLVSSELGQILALSDRILVIFEGRVLAQFSRGEATEDQIGLYMGGGHS